MAIDLNLENKKPAVRILKEMRNVLYDQDWAQKTPDDLKLYEMYRGLKRTGGMRYDLTIIPPQMLGEEFIRTKGNQNSDNLPELYQVLEGEAVFLLQRAKAKTIEEILVIKARENEFIHVPGDCSVVIINPGKKTLKIANWVSEENRNIYQELEKMGGMGYFYTLAGWRKNPAYEKVPPIRFENALKKIPSQWNFLQE